MNQTEIRRILNDLPADDLCALLIRGEADNQDIIGQLAVVHVAMNRAKEGGWFGRQIRGEEGVVLKPMQFSCFNDDNPRLPALVEAAIYHCPPVQHKTAKVIATLALSQLTIDPTKGATHYHTIARPRGVRNWPPKWTNGMIITAKIGGHIFYREK